MKKQDKKTAEMLKDKLAGFQEANPLPPELSKDCIIAELKEQPAPAVKKAKVITIRRAASFAAAFVVLLGSVTVYNLFGGSSGIKLAVDTLNGKTPLNQPAEISDANSYKEIRDIFKKLGKEASTKGYQYGKSYFSADSAEVADKNTAGAPTADRNALNEDSSGSQHGETNVQVKGIDEPDVMKNDGSYMYTCSNSEVNIYRLLPADNLKHVSTVKSAVNSSISEKIGEITSKSEYPHSLFVKGNQLVVFSTENISKEIEPASVTTGETKSGETANAAAPDDTGSAAAGSSGSGTNSVEPAKADDSNIAADEEKKAAYGYNEPGYYYGKSMSVCTVYDISDKSDPKEVKRISQDGNFISARLIGGELYILSSYSVDVYNNTRLNDVCIPAYSVDGKSAMVAAGDISVTKNPDPSYLVVCGLNLDDLTAKPDTKAVLGGGEQAYCTEDSLFVARTVYATTGTQAKGWGADIALAYAQTGSTEIYRFSIGGGEVEFDCAGKVTGTILNQFSMDEYNGYFRIATTQGQWGDTLSSNVFVLNNQLKVVGKVEKIAPKERIFAVRFMGDTGYVVTFEQTDPLFVLNLKDPAAPKIAGELKLPGFSSYLHPVGDTLLLGIGQNGNADGTTPGIKLSLFDISDPAKPKEIDKYVIEGNASTEAMNNHKAFMVYPEKNLFGLPVMSYNYTTAYDTVATEEDKVAGDSISSYTASIGTVASFNTYTVKDNQIVPVRNYKEAYKQSGNSYDYYGGISRGTYIGDTLYTLSNTALTSFSMNSGKLLDSLEIEQPANPSYPYYYGKGPYLAD